MITEIIEILGGIILGWLFIAFLFPLLFMPNQLIFKTKIQRSEKIRKVALRFKSKNKEEELKRVYEYVNKTYQGVEHKWKLANYPKHFLYNVEKLLDKKQFISCHIQNLVFITLLVNLGWKESSFIRKEMITKFLTIHQYIIVHTGKKSFYIDPFFNVFREHNTMPIRLKRLDI